mgnify:CR=1 FL=1
MKKKKILLVFKIIFVLLIILSLFGLLSWRVDNKNIDKIVIKEKEYLKEEDNGYLLEEEILEDNKYTIGWLKVSGTRIDYPVIKYKDNDYYLNHDFYNKKNSAGWIFMDYRNKLDDQNIIIYGHHRKDGIMFGDIDKLMKKKYYDSNDGKILLVINDENIYYQIFSVYKAESNSNYNQPNYDNFKEILDELKNRSSIKFDSNLDDVEQIITLVTCHDNNKDRLVVHAYKILP